MHTSPVYSPSESTWFPEIRRNNAEIAAQLLTFRSHAETGNEPAFDRDREDRGSQESVRELRLSACATVL